MTLPPFPVDDQTLGLLWGALYPDPATSPSSQLGAFCEWMSQLAGSDTGAVAEVLDEGRDGNGVDPAVPGLHVMRDPQYSVHDLVAALAQEVRRLRHPLPEHLRGDGPCSDCGTTGNVVWFTDSVFWNAVMRPPGYTTDPLLCIPCFVRRVDAAGYHPTGWRLLPDFHWETTSEYASRRASP